MSQNRKISKESKLEFSLDVLTDGSEYTGHGTVFLTVQKIRREDGADVPFSPHILARYAISGISSLTARLASDQNFHLSAVRAVFLPTIHDVNFIAGFPSLLLSLSNYSMSEYLYVVGDHGTDNFTEKISDMILSRRSYPKIASCVVPSKNCWWNVYSDEYIVVHAQQQERCSSSVVYIIGLKDQNYAFAVIPPNTSDSDPSYAFEMFHNLSSDITTKQIDSKLDLVVHIDPKIPKDLSAPQRNIAKYNVATIPNDDVSDPGLLIRATYCAKMLQSMLPSMFMFDTNNSLSPAIEATDKDFMKCYEEIITLKTGVSVVLPTKYYLHRGINIFRFVNRVDSISQKIHIKDMPNQDIEIPESIKKFYSESLVKLERKDSNEIDLDDFEIEDSREMDAPTHKRCKVSEEHIFQNANFPVLAMLGTGCSSPSPLRNSSGHVILLESKISIVIECGEGFLTMLRRHIRDTNNRPVGKLSEIRLIWISHAHLDHYGDLPILIHSIRQSHQSKSFCNCFDNPGSQDFQWDGLTESQHLYEESSYDFCSRCHRQRLPILIAPVKVLNYVDIMLGTKNGRQNNRRLFVGLSHQDFNHSPFAKYVRDDLFGLELVGYDKVSYRAIHDLRNIPVEHCPNSFGLIIALGSMSEDSKIFTICYSGDTRPSSNLIRACKDYSQANIQSLEHRMNGCSNKISLLIHEATFDNDTKGQHEAKRKRHSTVDEALSIGSQIEAESIILTHFSQRYPMLPPSYNMAHTYDCISNPKSMSVVSAYDGMIIPCRSKLKEVLPTIEMTMRHIHSCHFTNDSTQKRISSTVQT